MPSAPSYIGQWRGKIGELHNISNGTEKMNWEWQYET